MKNNEQAKIDSSKMYWDFRNLLRVYIEKDNIKKMYYARLYLLYLAKTNNLKLQIPSFSEYAESLGEKGIGFDLLLKDLLAIYEKDQSNAKEYLVLKKIKDVFEMNHLDKELDDRIFDEMSKLTIKEINNIFSKNSLEFKKYSSRESDASLETINELVSEILKIKNNEEILDLCSGNGDFLASLASENRNLKLNGIEINKDIAIISEMRLAVLSGNDAEIIVGDGLTYNFDKKFDKIFCDYPLGVRIDNIRLNKLNNELFFPWKKNGLTSDWMFLNKIVTLLNPKGMAAMIIGDGPLFKSMDKDYRKDILDSKVVKFIIKLPSRILPYTNISPNLLILSRENEKDEIKFVDATHEYIENNLKEKQLNVNAIMNLINGNNNDINKIKIVKASEISGTADALLTVNSYVGEKEPKYINPHLLKEFIIDKYRGYQLSAKEQAEIEDINGDYELLTISDIDEGIISNNLLRINGNNNKYDRYLLKSKDLVVSSKGTRLKVAVVEAENRKIIPNGNLLVLRLDTEKINPYYLQAFLNSRNGRLALEKIQTGAVIISINPSRIEQIKVSMINKKEQEVFAKKYKQKIAEFVSKQEKLKKLKKQIDNLFTNEIERKRGDK